MRKSELESMVYDHKRQITWLEQDVGSLNQHLEAIVECLNIVCVPPKTYELKYEKKGGTGA